MRPKWQIVLGAVSVALVFVVIMLSNFRSFPGQGPTSSLTTASSITCPASTPLNISSNIQIHFDNSVNAYDWSPDDSQILYGYGSDFWTMNPDGSNRTLLLSFSWKEMQSENTPSIYSARYAPDGKRLTFIGEVYGSAGLDTYDQPRYWNLYVVNINGTKLVKLTDGIISQQPSWSPDGQKIVFVKINLWNEESNLWVINADGTGLKQLTSLPGIESEPLWSPDGKKIAFTHQATPLGGQMNATLYVMNPDGSQMTRVPSNSTVAYWDGFSWGPDSSVIVASGDDDIYAFTIDGKTIRRLIAQGWNPLVSHDGKRILYEGPQPQTFTHAILNLSLATLEEPLHYEKLCFYVSVPPTVHLPPPPEKDILVNYKIELDNVEYTFNVSYKNNDFRGYTAEPGQRFLWITYTELNKGSKLVYSPLGTNYGLKLRFDDGSEWDEGPGGYGALRPGETLSSGGITTISVDIRVVTLIIFNRATGETKASIPVAG